MYYFEQQKLFKVHSTYSLLKYMAKVLLPLKVLMSRPWPLKLV